MDPFSLSTGIVGLVAIALKLVVGALGMIDKTVAAYDEAADELRGLQQDLKRLQRHMIHIHETLKVLASNTKDRAFKKLLRDEYGQAVVRELCDALEETFDTLTQMTDRTNSDDLQPAPLTSNKKSLEFTRAVLNHSITPSKITDLVKGLRDMRSDVQMCLTKLETTFQRVHTLYNIMNNGLARTASRTSIFSTSTNLTVRIELAAWLKKWEETWRSSIQRKSNSLRGFLQSKNATVAGISHMTDELLGKIFQHLCEAGPLSLRHLLFVSRRFYFAAVNNAHLWTTISLDPSFIGHFYQRREQANIFVEHCLLRSGSLPLFLYISHLYGTTVLLHVLKTFGKLEWRGFQRCTSLTWNVGGASVTMVQKILDLLDSLPKRLPSLKHISLSHFCEPRGGAQFPNCPVLERVEMNTHYGTYPPFWGANFRHVTTLSFGNFSDWWIHDVTTLSQFPALHDLTLFTIEGRGDIDRMVPIIFKHLQILRVRGHIPSKLLAVLVVPALEELHVKANAEHFTSIGPLQNSFNPFCQHIHALLPKAVSATEPEWATNLSMLVKKCARIKSLHISKWMEEECKEFMSCYDGVVLHVQ